MNRKRTATEHSAQIERLSHEGRGIALIDGKITFIQDALPNETVKFTYQRKKGQHDEGITTEVITPSSDRTTPICKHFLTCGGCSLQHMSHALQLSFKQQSVADLLHNSTSTSPIHWLAPLEGDQTHYRRKARLSVKYVEKKGKVLVGFRERNGRYVANIDQCDILSHAVGQQLDAISQCLLTLDAKSSIPQIEIAVSDTQTALIIRHLNPLSTHDKDALLAFGQTHDFTLYLQPKGPDTIHAFYPDTASALTYTLKNFPLTFSFQPQQFIQVNGSINDQMIKQTIDLLELTPTDHVLDLFCGIGNFSLPLALHCQHVTGVEADSSAIEQAKINAKNNQLENCSFYCADLFQNDYNVTWAQQRFDKILLDPPRSGAKEVLAYINKWQPTRIVYVSCNPATLARDAATLLAYGYELDTAGVMDMFPHTAHVEAMCLFVKR